MVENTHSEDRGIPARLSSERVDSSQNEYGQDEAMSAEESRKKVVIRAVITVLAILVGILLVLFVVSRVAFYDSIPAMVSDMSTQLGEAIRRIFA